MESKSETTKSVETAQLGGCSTAPIWSPILERIDEVLFHLRGELLKAIKKHAAMHSPHEGYAVILEELDELWDHVKADTGKTAAARNEALQIAAMGIRYVLDVAPMRVPCAACDRGDYQLGHAVGCLANLKTD